MSTIPKNPKTEIDGDGDGDGEPGKASGFATSKWRRHQVAKPVASIEKIFSDHHRSIPTNPNINLEFSPDNHTLVKMEMDTTRIEKIFSDHHRSRPTSPTKTNGFSSWDSDSEPEVVGQIFTSDDPWFNLAEGNVVHEEDMDDALDRFEAHCDEDTPLKFRRFMKSAVRKLRSSLDNRLKYVLHFDEEDDAASGKRPGEFNKWGQEIVFPVKRCRRAGSRPSDSPEF